MADTKTEYEIRISCDDEHGLEFAAWLNELGHDAYVGNDTGNHVDGVWCNSCEDAAGIINGLWDDFCRQQ